MHSYTHELSFLGCVCTPECGREHTLSARRSKCVYWIMQVAIGKRMFAWGDRKGCILVQDKSEGQIHVMKKSFDTEEPVEVVHTPACVFLLILLLILVSLLIPLLLILTDSY